ncbi:hypothetical protein FKW77_002199 [Venturia effusa]|uniref:Phosphatidate phosphatase APP1 catalytic domain-containing protein n=1 Tax=Venturia effusa TaxID=50376 RepID=A0A517LQY5_9PEZI|nr:hypothetical protein FKW77_002199 [Venturia effusa]
MIRSVDFVEALENAETDNEWEIREQRGAYNATIQGREFLWLSVRLSLLAIDCAFARKILDADAEMTAAANLGVIIASVPEIGLSDLASVIASHGLPKHSNLLATSFKHSANLHHQALSPETQSPFRPNSPWKTPGCTFAQSAVRIQLASAILMAPSHLTTFSALLATFTAIAHAIPNPVAAAAPEITPFQAELRPTPTLKRRENILSKLEGDVTSVLSALGSGIPSYVASGVPNFFQDFPTGDKVQSSLGIDGDQLAALPTQVLNIPPYGNWTNDGWQIRFRGNVYKQPNTSQSRLNDLANIFLIGTDISDLPAEQQDQARNLTAEIFVVQQSNQTVSMHLEPAPSAGGDGESGGGGAVTASGGTQDLTLPYRTTAEGDFDVFVPIQSNGLTAGNATQMIQRLNVYSGNSTLGNATAFLVPPTGFTVISDIDDILRVTKIYQPKEGLLNSFARAFVPWMNMPEIYANWSTSVPNMHFHYLTTTPEQVTRNYMDFIYKTYPGGSFDTRPLNFSDVSATLSIRKYLLTKYFQTFPQRKIILVADTSNSDVMKDYPQLAHDYPNQVQCILLRNTSATDDDKFPYNTAGFKNISQNKYMFFIVPDDLKNLDVTSGHCYNQTIKQNVTFGYQDELLGIHGSGAQRIGAKGGSLAALVTALFVGVMFLA